MTIERERGERPSRWPVRLAWFVGLWLAGVAAVGLVSLLIRAAIRP